MATPYSKEICIGESDLTYYDFFHSHNNYLLSIYYGPGTTLVRGITCKLITTRKWGSIVLNSRGRAMGAQKKY